MNTQLISPPSAWVPGTQVYAYLRDSGGSEQELSITRQVNEITTWASTHGITIARWFTDEARTGRTVEKREQLHAMMEAFRNQEKVGGVVVWAYDRFARNATEAQTLRLQIRALGYQFHSLTDYIPEGNEKIVFEAFKDYLAQQYSETLSRNVKSGSHSVLRSHGVMGGFPPKGFIRTPVDLGIHRNGKPRVAHRWDPDPDLAPTIRLAFEMRARGATLKEIMQATHLYPSINSYTTFFTNRLYMGILEYGGEVIENYCAPIVSAELWEQAAALGRTRARITTKHNPRRYASPFLFSGLIFCQHCGAPLNGHIIRAKNKPARHYYACSRQTRRRDCPARQIPARPLEKELIQKLEDLALDLERMLIFQTKVIEHLKTLRTQKEGERLKLRRDLREQTKRIHNLTTAIAERGTSRALHTALHNAELEEATIRYKLNILENEMQDPPTATPTQLADLAAEIKTALHGEDLQKKKHAIHMITSRIVTIRTHDHIESVLYYIPANVCLGKGTPTQMPPEGIQVLIPFASYAPRPK